MPAVCPPPEEEEYQDFGNAADLDATNSAGIAAFERKHGAGSASDSDDDDSQESKPCGRIPKPGSKAYLQSKCELLEKQLKSKQRELKEIEADLFPPGGEGEDGETTSFAENPGSGATYKKKLFQLGQKSRRQQVTIESQKTKIATLEKHLDLALGKVAALSSSGGAAAAAAAPAAGAGPPAALATPQRVEDQALFRDKYLRQCNQVQELRQELSDAKDLASRMRKVLLRDYSTVEAVNALLLEAYAGGSPDVPGGATTASGLPASRPELLKKINELKKRLVAAGGTNLQGQRGGALPPTSKAPVAGEGADGVVQPPLASKTKHGNNIEQLADKRRALLDSLQKENEVLKGKVQEAKQKQMSNTGRVTSLENQVGGLKTKMSLLVEKSERDDKLVDSLRKAKQDLEGQIGRQAKVIQGLQMNKG
eukprot:g15437.t1